MDEQLDNDAIRVMQQRQQRQHKQEQLNDEHLQPENHEEERPTHYVPLWSNLDLPGQDTSIVAHAAHMLQSKCVAVPENPALAPTKRRLEHAKDAFRVPCEFVTTAVYEAFTAMSTVLVLHRDNDVKRVVVAELAELKAAAQHGPPADAMGAAPRRYALTILIPQASKCTDRQFILDAMALLSSDGDAPGRAANSVRMTVLTNEQAIFYAEKTDDRPLDGSNGVHAELAFAHVTDDGVRKALYAPLAHCGSAKKVFAALVKAIARIFKQAGLPLPPSLTRSASIDSASLADSYVKANLKVNHEFWKRLCHVETPPKLDHQLRFGDGPEHQTFLKLVPRQLPSLDHPNVYFGMLMFREGCDVKKSEYVLEAMIEERRRVNLSPQTPVGLRPPQADWEREVAPHVLSMSATVESFRGDLCCYTTRGVPGQMMTPYDNASMPCLEYALRPFNDAFSSDKFVLPCTQDQIDELHDMHCKAQWAAAKEGFEKYATICGVTDKSDGDAADAAGAAGAAGAAVAAGAPEFKTKKLKGLPSIEEEALAAMVGIPLGSAFRLGEVNEAVSRSTQELKVIRAFLTASILRLGRNASIADALQTCVDTEAERCALVAQVNQLGEELKSARALPLPPPSATAEIVPCCTAVAEMCITAMNLKAMSGTVIDGPMTPGKVVAIGRVLAVATLSPPQPKTLHDDDIRKHYPSCKGLSVVGTAAYLAKRRHNAPLYIVVALKDNAAMEFYKASDRGNGDIVKVSPLEMMAACTKTDASLMIKYCVEKTKLSALVPNA